MQKLFSSLKKGIHRASMITNALGVGLLLVMVLLIVADVLMRWLLNKPLGASYELVEFMMGLVVMFGLAYTQMEKGHVRVRLLIVKLPFRVQAAFRAVVSLLGMGLIALVTWQTVLKGQIEAAVKSTSAVLHVPVYPFLYAAAFGTALLCLVLLLDFFNALMEAVTGHKLDPASGGDKSY